MRRALVFMAGALVACDPSLLTVELAPAQALSVVVLYLSPDNTLVEALAFNTEMGVTTLPRRPGPRCTRCPIGAR